MPELETTFGFYPYDISLDSGDIYISPLSTLPETLVEIKEDPYVYNDWFYPGPQIARTFGVGEIERPYSARLFSLPNTHKLIHSSSLSEEHTDFLIWGFGFCKGQHVSQHPNAFLDAASVKTGTITDFSMDHKSFEKAMALLDQFWIDHLKEPRHYKRVIAVINALYLAERPHLLDYEEFNLLYMALDSLSKLTQTLFPAPAGRIPHTKRIKAMCDALGLTTPDWACPNPKNSEISIIRNDTLHEALFFGEPLGYAVYDNQTTGRQHRNVLLEMKALICRLLIAILFGTTNQYIRSPTGTRQRYRLAL